MEALFCTLWGTLLAPLIVALVVTTYNYWLNNKTKKISKKKDELQLVLFCYIVGNFVRFTTYL